jgi:hypothetical protein
MPDAAAACPVVRYSRVCVRHEGFRSFKGYVRQMSDGCLTAERDRLSRSSSLYGCEVSSEERDEAWVSGRSIGRR